VARRPRGTRNGSTNAQKEIGIMDNRYDQTEKQFRFAEQPEPKPELAVKESEL